MVKKTTKRNTGGFTLIELLVVLAIIGMLAGIVIVSLNSARGRAANNAIKANLNNIRGQSLIYFGSNNFSFGPTTNSCGLSSGRVFGDPYIISMINANNAIVNGSGCWGTFNAWVVRSPLKVQEGNFTYWCVDHTGVSKGVTPLQVTNWIGGNYACP